MNKNNELKTHRRGLTLIEALFVLGIMAILIGLVMVLYSMASEKQKTQQLITEVSLLIDACNSLTDSQSSYKNLDSKSLAKSGLIPSKFIKDGLIVTPYGGKIEVIPFNYQKDHQGDNIYLAFNFLYLPQSACERLGLLDYKNVAQSVTVTGMQEDHPDGFTPIQVIKNCDNGNNNYVNIRIQH